MKSNTEIAICEVCGERFQKRKIGQKNAGGMRIRPIRPAHAQTCSRECSRKKSNKNKSISHKKYKAS